MEYQKVPITCDAHFFGYKIDTKGVVYRKNGKPLKPSSFGRCLLVTISVGGKRYTRQVHRLVAAQFIPNPKNKATVNHIDGNPKNNNVENLEWATQSEQMIHARNVLGIAPANKIPIMGISIDRDLILSFPSISEAAAFFNTTRDNIDQVITKRHHSSCGYFWLPVLNSKEQTIEALKRLKKEKLSVVRRIRKVGMFSKSGELLKVFPNAYSTRLEGFSDKIVNKCCLGKGGYKTHRGFIWHFVDEA